MTATPEAFSRKAAANDYIGAAALLDSLPRAQWLLGDRGDDADWFREALQAKGITPVSLAASLGRSQSVTTSAGTKAETASR